jgi:hypothetical protein
MPPDKPAAVELGPVASKVSASLGGAVPRERIEALIRDLLEQEFSDARVTAFLPVFLHRYAIEALRHEAAAARAP